MRASFFRFVTLSLAAASVIFMGASCSSHNATFDSLANEGIIPVSTDNPYLGSNVFLAREMEDSNYLYNFIKGRGAPTAIELHGSSEKSASLHMYYSDKRESYTATPQFNSQNQTKEWIVRGPYSLDRETYRALATLHNDHGGVFEIFGKRETFGGSAKAAQTRVIAPAFVPTPKPTPRPVVRKAPTEGTSTQPSGDGPQIVSSDASNLDQEALLEARKKALLNTPAPAASGAPAVAPKVEEKTKSLDDALEKAVNPTAVPGAKVAGEVSPAAPSAKADKQAPPAKAK
jgi:hypothetical protein